MMADTAAGNLIFVRFWLTAKTVETVEGNIDLRAFCVERRARSRVMRREAKQR